jgi:predicted  nucleic acid-binding Zn-ribbon protein
MRNDDPEYVRSLERALQAAEREIAELERELTRMDKTIEELRALTLTTYMGEPK